MVLRGTGKPTLLANRYPDALWIDLLDAQTERNYSMHPEYLNDLLDAHPEKKIVIIDEVQRVPRLLPIVHSIIFSSKSKIQFILTGSSVRSIKRQGSDLLGGRASERHMHPFMASELGKSFFLEQSLKYGLIPLVYNEDDPNDVLQGYLSLYLKEEIKMEGLVRNLNNFSRFLETMSFSHGSLLNVSNISRECGIKRKTVDNYLDILEDLLLSYRINVFHKHAKHELSSHPKFYFFDTGVYQIIRPRGVLDTTSEINGAALEGLIGQHLRAWCHYTKNKHDLYFWRTSSGAEVDFVVYGEDGLWAVEVKHANHVDTKDIRALKTFMSDYPGAKAAIVYRGKDKFKKNGVLCIPAESFLLNIVPNEELF